MEYAEARPRLSVFLADDLDSVDARGEDIESVRIHRMRQPELGGGIRERADVRRDAMAAGNDTTRVCVAIDIDVLIAVESGSARAELRRRELPLSGPTVRYVGTPRGLVSLILDLYVCEVADAVVLHPLDSDSTGPGDTRDLITREVMPILASATRQRR